MWRLCLKPLILLCGLSILFYCEAVEADETLRPLTHQFVEREMSRPNTDALQRKDASPFDARHMMDGWTCAHEQLLWEESQRYFQHFASVQRLTEDAKNMLTFRPSGVCTERSNILANDTGDDSDGSGEREGDDGYCNDSLVCHVNFKDDSTEEFPFSTSSVRFFDSNLDLFPRAANDYPPCTTFYNTSVHETEPCDASSPCQPHRNAVLPACPMYRSMSCCVLEQTLRTSITKYYLGMMWGKCPACFSNIEALLCGYTCSPYQGNFLEVLETKNVLVNDTNGNLVNATKAVSYNFTVHPEFVQGFYDSCKAVTLDGGVYTGGAFSTGEDFLNFLLAKMGVETTIANVSTAFNPPTESCVESCNCESCKEACDFPLDLNVFGKATCFVTVYGYSARCETVVLTIGYVCYCLALLWPLIGWYSYKFEWKKSSLPLWRKIALPLLPVVGLAITALGAALFPIDDGVELFNGSTNWGSAVMIPLGLVISLLILCVLTVGVVIRVVSSIRQNALPPTPFETEEEEANPLLGTQNAINDVFDDESHPYIAAGEGSLSSNSAYDDYSADPSARPKVYAGGAHLSDAMSPRSSSSSFRSLPATMRNTTMEVSMTERKQSPIEKAFYYHGRFVARHPILVILGALVFTAAMGVGVIFLQVNTKPVDLWSTPSSQSYQQMEFFNDNFGGFYRVESAIITTKDSNKSILDLDVLNVILTMQQNVMQQYANYTYDNGTTIKVFYEDLCFRPYVGSKCDVESALEYWQSNRTLLNTAGPPIEYLSNCLESPLNPACMSSAGAPIQAQVVFGGFSGVEYLNCTALIVTFLLTNDPVTNPMAAEWELQYLNVVSADWPLINIAYSSARSVQDEISREGAAQVPVVILSYLAMFLYVSLALGDYYPLPTSWWMWLVRSRFVTGLAGVAMVMCSVLISVGINSYIGVKATLIISEVIPFLVLAIGVDNIFILVDTFEKTDPRDPIDERMGKTLATVGLSITLASLSESAAFLLGLFVQMPAVSAFAVYSAVAVFFDFILQITAFLAILTYDSQRMRGNRMDCMPCLQLPPPPSPPPTRKQPTGKSSGEGGPQNKSFLRVLVRKYYAPFLVHPATKIAVMVLFVGFFAFSLNNATQVELGLDQQTVMPDGSYMITYFDAQEEYQEVGTPFYVVVNEAYYDYSTEANQNVLCTVAGCLNDSVVNLYSSAPYVAGVGFSWLDDYLSWCKPELCCLKDKSTGKACVFTDLGSYAGNPDCTYCFANQTTALQRPDSDVFYDYLDAYLAFDLAPSCPLVGIAYPPDIVFSTEADPPGPIKTSRFRFYHTPLITQNDYINALNTVYSLADYISETLHVNVFPYAIWYVFFEQYLTMSDTVAFVVGAALGGVFLVTLILEGNPLLSLYIVLTIGMIETGLLGVMTLWNIQMNGISLVNLAMVVQAAIEMVPSVINGITLTKFFGVVVLAFAPSQLFKIYYFRMYFTMVVLGALHGLLFLPVVLSLIGPPSGLNMWTFCYRLLEPYLRKMNCLIASEGDSQIGDDLTEQMAA